MKSKRKHGRMAEGWHHRVPDFELVYCGPQTDKHKDFRPGRLRNGTGASRVERSGTVKNEESSKTAEITPP